MRGVEALIVVVDNASEPEDVVQLLAIKSAHPEVELVLNPTNVGYFRGLNIGLRKLRQAAPDLNYVVVGNNDLEFPMDFVERLCGAIEDLKHNPVLSPDVVTVDGVHQNPHVISTISIKRQLMYDLYYSNYHIARLILRLARRTQRFTDRDDESHWQTARNICQGHGSCYILGPLFFRNFEELWAPTFMMSEEYFLSKQLSDKGMSVYYQPAVQVIHHYHASVGRVPARRMWELARDAHREYRKYVRIFG
jgi:GT2 family glycosyltransferase